MMIGYRAILRLDDSADAVAVAEAELRTWFRSKLRRRGRGALLVDDWDGEGEFNLGNGAQLRATHCDDDRDLSRRRAYRFSESNSGRTWDVSVLALSTPAANGFKQSLVIEAGVSGSDADDPVELVDPPRIVRNLLDTAVVTEGRTRLTAEPVLVGDLDGVHDALAAVTDNSRTSSVIIATSVDLETERRFVAAVSSLTRFSVGVATTFVISARMAEEFDSLVPRSHQVPRGRVRTYLPGVRFDLDEDALRHRVLGPATFARSLSDGRVARPLQVTHAASMKRRFLSLELPADIRRSLSVLAQAENRVHRRALVDARVSSPVSSAVSTQHLEAIEAALQFEQPTHEPVTARREPAQAFDGGLLSRLTKIVRRWVKADAVDEATMDRLDRFIETRASEVTVAEEEIERQGQLHAALLASNAELNERIQSVELDLAIEAEALRKAEREAGYFKSRLLALQAFDHLSVPHDDEAWKPPVSIAEIVAILQGGESSDPAPGFVKSRIEFTGDLSTVVEIDKRDAYGQYAARVWDFIRVIHDYVGARQAGWERGTMHIYLSSDDAPEGFKCTPSRHAATESDSVYNNSSWSRERLLPVPVEVDVSGRMMMGAHFKVSTNDTFAPRLHYFDDTENTGKVYIGYIGKHLTNKQT
ncbi:hypothetical protein HQQ81_18315 [Microbacteriaceae bacterium VKM Ac-2854]|nr:hypothetical protein [Microbacteriaceae bacterium VKM Ac-2854]